MSEDKKPGLSKVLLYSAAVLLACLMFIECNHRLYGQKNPANTEFQKKR